LNQNPKQKGDCDIPFFFTILITNKTLLIYLNLLSHCSSLSYFSASVSGGAVASSAAAAVKEYERLVGDYVPKFVALSKQIGPDVAEQAELFQKGVNIVRDIIARAAETKEKPADFNKWLAPLEELTQQITNIKEKNRGPFIHNTKNRLFHATFDQTTEST
jgi:hypothetical protein